MCISFHLPCLKFIEIPGSGIFKKKFQEILSSISFITPRWIDWNAFFFLNRLRMGGRHHGYFIVHCPTNTFSFITIVQFSKYRHLTLIQYYFLIHSPYLNFVNCLNKIFITVFSWSRIQPESHIEFTCHVFLVSLIWKIPQPFFCLNFLYFVEHSSIGVAWHFLMTRFRLHVFGRNITEMMYSSQCTVSEDTGCWFIEYSILF